MGDTFCPYMWIQQCITTTGGVQPCCNSYVDDPLWRKLEYKEGIKAKRYEDERIRMRKGRWPLVCKVCKDYEQLGSQSPRHHALNDWPDITPTSTPHVKFLDIKYTNTCNLACRMCKPTDSSMIEDAFRNKNIDEIPHYLTSIGGVNNDRTVLDLCSPEEKVEYTKKCIKEGLVLLKVTGGEPLACKYFMSIINWAIENDFAKNLSLKFTTNATKYNKSFIDKTKHFKHIQITISCDGTENIYNYIRNKGDWNQLYKNLQLISKFKKAYPNKTWVQLSTVLQYYNMLNISSLANLCAELDFAFHVDIFLRPKDSELQVKWASEKLLNILKSDCENILKKSKDTNTQEQMEKIIKYIDSNSNWVGFKKTKRNKFSQLKQSTARMDTVYNTNFKDYLMQEQIQHLQSRKGF